jgi:hypothetical protein
MSINVDVDDLICTEDVEIPDAEAKQIIANKTIGVTVGWTHGTSSYRLLQTHCLFCATRISDALLCANCRTDEDPVKRGVEEALLVMKLKAFLSHHDTRLEKSYAEDFQRIRAELFARSVWA